MREDFPCSLRVSSFMIRASKVSTILQSSVYTFEKLFSIAARRESLYSLQKLLAITIIKLKFVVTKMWIQVWST